MESEEQLIKDLKKLQEKPASFVVDGLEKLIKKLQNEKAKEDEKNSN